MSEQRNHFGTDGVRGRVGVEPITPDFVMRLGWAAGKVFSQGRRGRVLVGKDTRISGYILESALEAGLASAGADVLLLGPMPTPAIAYLTRTLGASAGVVISASHNPYHDNGIKFFSGCGSKLPDATEQAIEALLDQPMAMVEPAALGKAERLNDAPGRYIEFCKGTVEPWVDLSGLKIVVDCAHGAAYHIAPHVFGERGATVIPIGVAPDGFNINAGCGSTAPEALQQAVAEHGADLGIAFDGDADRVVMVDGRGQLIDGDALLWIIANDRRDSGGLIGGVVGTVMSNLGLELAFEAAGVPFSRAAVGDRYVLERLREHGWQLGGEASGHILCLDKATTGDGIVAALQVLRAMVRSGRSLDELCAGMERLPQVLVNVTVARRFDPMAVPRVAEAVAAVEARMGRAGRVLLRASGTEPKIRVMVEGEDAALVDTLATELAEVVRGAVVA